MAEWRLIETGDRYGNGDVEYLLERSQQCVRIGSYMACMSVLKDRMRRRDVFTEMNLHYPKVTVSYECVMAQDAATEAFLRGDYDECDRIKKEIGWQQ